MNTFDRATDAGIDLLVTVAQALENPDTSAHERNRLAQALRAMAASKPSQSDLTHNDEFLRLIPRTADELVAFVGSNFSCFENVAPDKEDWSYQLSVHDLLSSFDFHFQEIIYACLIEANSQSTPDQA